MPRATVSDKQTSQTKQAVKLSSVSLGIPAYNDETTIGRLIDDSAHVLASMTDNFEIVVINDGSKDGTADVLSKAVAQYPFLRLINHPVNQGYGATIRELYLSGKNDYIATLPGDYQYAPKELVTMASALSTDDFVIGLRVKRNDPARRKVQSAFYNFLLRILYGSKLKDVNSIKLFKREVLQTCELKSHTPFVDAELCIKAQRHGYRISEVPIEHLPRLSAGASGGKISVILDTFSDLFKMRHVF